jgi:hypothetical protein
MQIMFKDVILNQFRGRKYMWVFALVLSSIVVPTHFIIRRPTCDLMFYPREVATDYAIAWVCLLVFLGITRRAKIVFALAVLLWLGTKPLVEYRVPTSERRAMWRLSEMQQNVRTAKKPPLQLSDILGLELGKAEVLSGYHFEYSPDIQNGVLTHYVITARPQCYCRTGQRSFVIDDSGTIHFTTEDRAASMRDAVLRQDYER